MNTNRQRAVNSDLQRQILLILSAKVCVTEMKKLTIGFESFGRFLLFTLWRYPVPENLRSCKNVRTASSSSGSSIILEIRWMDIAFPNILPLSCRRFAVIGILSEFADTSQAMRSNLSSNAVRRSTNLMIWESESRLFVRPYGILTSVRCWCSVICVSVLSGGPNLLVASEMCWSEWNFGKFSKLGEMFANGVFNSLNWDNRASWSANVFSVWTGEEA